MEDLVVRKAVLTDLSRVAALAGDLVRMHHRADRGRFLLVDDVETGYARWFGRELERRQAAVLVACSGQVVVGYAYGTLEGRDWNRLLDQHGAVHDLFVEEGARRKGVGGRLLSALVQELEDMGAMRFVLSTMVANERAQAVFRACGFRPTMLEMTRDFAKAPASRG